MCDTLLEFRTFVDLIEGRAMTCDGPVTHCLYDLHVVGTLPAKEIAERYGVHTGTVYYRIDRKHAAIRREQWRICTARRKAERRAAA
ncbi:hypothetical protein [Rhizobium sp.]|uniref:hypothetical protein n=1 Tax=Rhizobium sp. TaxID=391 RepID=UPI0028A290C6